MDGFTIFIIVYTFVVITLPALIYAVYYTVMPPLETKTMREKVERIAQFLGIQINSEFPLPTVHILEEEEIIAMNPEWDSFESSDFWEVYQHKYLRLNITTTCRQDILYHGLAHYVQFQYGKVPLAELEMEREAWECAKLLMLIYHPFRYQLATMLFYGIWKPNEVKIV